MNRVIYLCRALRPTRVYQSPNDQQPSDKILPAGILFYSANQITIHNKMCKNKIMKVDTTTTIGGHYEKYNLYWNGCP